MSRCGGDSASHESGFPGAYSAKRALSRGVPSPIADIITTSPTLDQQLVDAVLDDRG